MGIIRVLLSIAVIFNHISPYHFLTSLINGELAVQCFFIISGFYMAFILNEKYSLPKDFYFNRFLRIYSGYWAVFFLMLFLDWVVGNENILHQIIFADLPWDAKCLLIFSNLFIIASDWILFFFPSQNGLVFTNNIWQHPPYLWQYHEIPPAWSLPLELMFYAMAPFIVRSKKKLLFLAALSLLFRFLTYAYISAEDPWNHRFFLSELLLFCLGALSYPMYKKARQYAWSRHVGIALILIMVTYMLGFNQVPVIMANNRMFPGQKIQLFMCLFFAMPVIFWSTKNNTIDRWLGELSYPVYLTHFPLLSKIGAFPILSSNEITNILLYVIIFSILIHHTIQYVIVRRFKHKVNEEKDSNDNRFSYPH